MKAARKGGNGDEGGQNTNGADDDDGDDDHDDRENNEETALQAVRPRDWTLHHQTAHTTVERPNGKRRRASQD